MRHRSKTKQFNRDTKARQALIKGLVRSLVEHGSITTTVPKAKEVKRISDRLFARAKQDTLANRRLLHTFFGRRDVVNTVFERIMPVVGERTSGFTRIIKLGQRRGDNTEVVTLTLVQMPEAAGSLKAPADKKAKPETVAPAVKKPARKRATQPKAAKPEATAAAPTAKPGRTRKAAAAK